MAGHYTVAIDHYRVALSMNPQFYSSQFGIADTYMLMGDETRARQEYEKAFQKFPSLPELDCIRWKTREAATYLLPTKMISQGQIRPSRHLLITLMTST